MDPKPYEGKLEFDVEGSTHYVVARASDEEMPSQSENRHRGKNRLHVGVIYRQNGTVVLETPDTSEVFRLDQVRQILQRMQTLD